MYWSTSQTERLKQLRADGTPSRLIAKAMGLSYRQVVSHLQWLGLARDGQRNSLRAKSNQTTAEHRRNTVETLIQARDPYDVGYVLGVLLGDGSISKQARGGQLMRLRVRDKEFAEKFEKALSAVCPADTHISACYREFHQPSSTIRTPEHNHPMPSRLVHFWEVTCCDAAVVSFFSKMKSEFHKAVPTPEGFKGLTDGLWDSDGYFIQTKNYAGLKMTAHALVHWVSEKLKALGVANKIYFSRTGYLSRISIHRKEAVRRFCLLTRFSIPRKETIRRRILEASA